MEDSIKFIGQLLIHYWRHCFRLGSMIEPLRLPNNIFTTTKEDTLSNQVQINFKRKTATPIFSVTKNFKESKVRID